MATHLPPPISDIVALCPAMVIIGGWMSSSVFNVNIISCPTVAKVVSVKSDLYDT